MLFATIDIYFFYYIITINRCIIKRQELIANMKKVQPTEKKKYKDYNEEESEEDIFNFNDICLKDSSVSSISYFNLSLKSSIIY